MGYEEALYVRQKLLGPQHTDTITTKFNLSEVYLKLGMTKRASQIQEEVVAAVGHNEAVRTGEKQQAAAQAKQPDVSGEDRSAERALAESLDRLNVPDDEDGWDDEHSPQKEKDAWDAGMDDDWGREGESSDDDDEYDGPLNTAEQAQLDSM